MIESHSESLCLDAFQQPTSRMSARRRAKRSDDKRIASLVAKEMAKVIPQIVAQVHSLSNSRASEDVKTEPVSSTNTSKPVILCLSRVKNVFLNYSSGSMLSSLPFVKVGALRTSELLALPEYFNREHSTGGLPNATNVGSPQPILSLGMS
ncbi:hypothetical protein Hanom_Chr15g01370781 [Helianthus anomalus]